MIAAFGDLGDLVHFNLKEEEQELVEFYSDRWSDFADALFRASFVKLEWEQFTWEEQMYKGEKSGYNVSCTSVPTMTRANLEAVVNACLMEDTQLLFKTDTEIVEAVYARLGMQEAISVQQGLHSAKRDTLLQSKKDVVGELGEYNLSSLFKGANMQDPKVIPHEVCMPMHEQTLVSESFKTSAVDLI